MCYNISEYCFLSPLSEAYLLFISFVTWLGYFSKVYFSPKGDVFGVPPHRVQINACLHSFPGMTVVLTGLSSTFSFIDYSVKLSATFGINTSSFRFHYLKVNCFIGFDNVMDELFIVCSN